ncbi:hypothetical protein Acsp04_60840 [Actinomadura sp. NBRC 104425]|uniref:hypothetical protein n=1 Tax=Actinomadura sp. NBRC 104425 TaxID=3032204 RepID=UPI0024A2E87C|nr:hypothetical protein [Actinomadura sp. NBRC 104425]GLZ15849.1 hypothetical protein Acsp04_60840 [Actinomadura sp. NBRC 104425]
MRHRPYVEPVVDGCRIGYRMRCTCGQAGEVYETRRVPRYEVDSHIATLPRVPVGQQCRDRRAHGRRPWEPYELCTNQMALF